MKTKLLLISIFLITPLVGFSHVVSGKVVDIKSKNPIEFATVWVEGTGIGTVTDANGNFLINNLSDGNYEIIIRCLGYTEKKEKTLIPQHYYKIFFLST